MKDHEIVREVLLNCYVPLIDEVAELIQQRGGPSLAPILDFLGEGIAFPAWVSKRESDAAAQRAIKAEILRYRAEVEAPAAAILRERKAASPSSVRKAAFGRDAVLLAGLEPDLSRLAKPPQVSSLALRVSSELSVEAAHKFPGGAFIAGADHNIVAFYVGPYRPGIPSPGFYLVYDAWAESLAAAPQLPSSSISLFSHCSIGSVTAVLRHGPPSDYILAELLPRIDDSGLATNKASLCMWWSSGQVAGRWIQKEVVLPLHPEPEEHGYTFCADTVFAVGKTCLCWVDLLTGILMCEDMLVPDPVFRFIPLPKAYVVRPDPLHGRGVPEEYRSLSCTIEVFSHGHTIKFISLDGYREGWPANSVRLTIWSLLLSDSRSEWDIVVSMNVRDIWFDPLYNDLKLPLPLLAPKRPLLSVVDNDTVYLNMTDFSDMHEQLGTKGHYVLSLKKESSYMKVSSAFKMPSQSGSIAHMVASPLSGPVERTEEAAVWGQKNGFGHM